MLLYRVFPYLSSARTGEPGHPLYLHPGQGTGRWDNPASYLAWYMAHEPTSAVGEVFASVSVWREEMFPFDHIPGARRALAVYQLPDDLPYVDLDDAQTLVHRRMRPSQVLERNRPYTQAKALEIYHKNKWNGLRWWSFHRPQWRVWCLWNINPMCEDIQVLDVSHAAVRDAAGTLVKSIRS
ncbi:MAG: RES family NAD+ phosphorylase [Actinomycetota bacterium]|nr:RES family NAD+ phosphorylase [Actinomycetota bacterium]